MKKILLSAFIVLIIIAAFCSPVSAKIQYTPDVQYDANGITPAFGEEIHVTLVITPGETDVKNLIINLRDADALIDDTNPNLITKTISPAGAAINISRVGNTFTIDQLQKGQTITIAFNAYPKTLHQQILHVADIEFSYTQLGDRIEQPYEPITVQMDTSSWFLLQNAQSENDILRETTKSQTDLNMKVFYGSIVLIVVAGMIIILFFIKRREYAREYAAQKQQKDALILDLIRKVDLAENNKAEFESLKKRLRSELGSDAGPDGSGKKEKDQRGFRIT
jgi:hypothetical protein